MIFGISNISGDLSRVVAACPQAGRISGVPSGIAWPSLLYPDRVRASGKSGATCGFAMFCDVFHAFQFFAMFTFPDFCIGVQIFCNVFQIFCGRVTHMVSACRDRVTFSSSFQP